MVIRIFKKTINCVQLHLVLEENKGGTSDPRSYAPPPTTHPRLWDPIPLSWQTLTPRGPGVFGSDSVSPRWGLPSWGLSTKGTAAAVWMNRVLPQPDHGSLPGCLPSELPMLPLLPCQAGKQTLQQMPGRPPPASSCGSGWLGGGGASSSDQRSEDTPTQPSGAHLCHSLQQGYQHQAERWVLLPVLEREAIIDWVLTVCLRPGLSYSHHDQWYKSYQYHAASYQIISMIWKLRLKDREPPAQGHIARPWPKPDEELTDSLMCHPGKWLHLSEPQSSHLWNGYHRNHPTGCSARSWVRWNNQGTYLRHEI